MRAELGRDLSKHSDEHGEDSLQRQESRGVGGGVAGIGEEKTKEGGRKKEGDRLKPQPPIRFGNLERKGVGQQRADCSAKRGGTNESGITEKRNGSPV